MSYLEQILGQRPYIKKDEEKPYSIFPYPNDGTGTGHAETVHLPTWGIHPTCTLTTTGAP